MQPFLAIVKRGNGALALIAELQGGAQSFLRYCVFRLYADKHSRTDMSNPDVNPVTPRMVRQRCNKMPR